MLPFGKIFAIRYCQTKSFLRGRKEIRHIPQHFISSFIVCRVVEQQGSLIRWAPCGLHIKRQKTTESIQFIVSVGATDEQMSKACFTVPLSKGVSVGFTVISKRTNNKFNIGHKKLTVIFSVFFF